METESLNTLANSLFNNGNGIRTLAGLLVSREFDQIEQLNTSSTHCGGVGKHVVIARYMTSRAL